MVEFTTIARAGDGADYILVQNTGMSVGQWSRLDEETIERYSMEDVIAQVPGHHGVYYCLGVYEDEDPELSGGLEDGMITIYDGEATYWFDGIAWVIARGVCNGDQLALFAWACWNLTDDETGGEIALLEGQTFEWVTDVSKMTDYYGKATRGKVERP